MRLTTGGLSAGVLTAMLTLSAHAAVRVIVGPTPIEGGEAKSAGDITVVNEKLAFALAVTSPVPYGVPRGAIIDAAPVTQGKDRPRPCGIRGLHSQQLVGVAQHLQHVEILERGPDRAVVRTVRDWGQVTVTTVYTLESNADSVAIRTTMSEWRRGTALICCRD
jgi:hypothetical protein